MDFSRRIYNYCERGFLPGPGADDFWAEPWNAATNGSFMFAALLGLILALRAGRLDGPVIWLTVLTFAVGVGSFLFHTYAVVWAALTDTIPIMLFILSYFAIAMRCYGGFGWGRSLMLMFSFFLLLIATSTVLRYGLGTPAAAWAVLSDTNDESYIRRAGGIVAGLIAVPTAAHFVLRSLIGVKLRITAIALVVWIVAVAILSEIAMATVPSFFPGMRSYLPALFALAGVGLWLTLRGHPAGKWLLAAAAVFLVSLTFRALDRPLCAHFLIGTHWLWHVLNGVVLGTLLVALIRHGGPRAPDAPGRTSAAARAQRA